MKPAERRELLALRLGSQLLDGARRSPVEVVRHLLAMQAQDFAGAKWSIGLRSGATDAAVEQALIDREIVRSWPMRGTLHFVAAEDLGWMLAISEPRQASWAAKRRSDLGITDAQLARAEELFVETLSGGRVARRDDLLAVLEADGIPTTNQRGYHFLWNLAHSALIVHGPPDGKQPTFALLDEWVAAPRRLEGDEALAEFARRYFASHGPATERDFAWWASITLGDARRGIAAAALESREVDGKTYLFATESPIARSVLALPGFDELMLGYQDRAVGLDLAYWERIVPGNNGIFQPTIVVDGRVVGTWRRKDGTKAVTVTPELFETGSKRITDGFASSMRRYSAFLGKPVVVGG